MKHFDIGSISIIAITFTLFVVALFTKGFTHDLLLESSVFLISVKLIIMAYKLSLSSKKTYQELKEIKKLLKDKL